MISVPRNHKIRNFELTVSFLPLGASVKTPRTPLKVKDTPKRLSLDSLSTLPGDLCGVSPVISPATTPRTPKTPVTRLQAIGYFFDHAITRFMPGVKPTRFQLVQLWMHVYDKVRIFTKNCSSRQIFVRYC